MDRLLSSSSSSSLHTNLKPFTLLPPTTRFDSARFNLFRRTRCSFPLISCDHENPPPLSSSSVPKTLPSLSSSQLIHSHTSIPQCKPLNQITSGNFQNPKAITARIFAILSALVLLLIHPAFTPAAFAAFQNAAKTGGPAAAAVGGKLIRTELLSSAWTGFLAGCLHTLSGPDHLAALAPLSIGRTRMESAAVGALWGCGHDAGQVIFGLIFLLLKDRLHIEVIRTWGTRVVGLTLLVIGAMGIKEASEVPTPCVALENGECDVSVYESHDSNPVVGKKKIGFATFATGIVHGLQPDALMMVLPALALPSRLAGAAFLIMFLLGTVVAMGSYTVFIGSCSQALKDRVPRITEKLTWASSLVAIALGFAILISQFFGFSLY
ncbi:Urease accessory protein UreH [Spatholobus suberectus]|nr:Urease accessory protein UreH [Spatholobus suberectus]